MAAWHGSPSDGCHEFRINVYKPSARAASRQRFCALLLMTKSVRRYFSVHYPAKFSQHYSSTKPTAQKKKHASSICKRDVSELVFGDGMLMTCRVVRTHTHTYTPTKHAPESPAAAAVAAAGIYTETCSQIRLPIAYRRIAKCAARARARLGIQF